MTALGRLAVAAAMISHCGHGSVMKALAAGVPILCMPIAREQPENAARVAVRELEQLAGASRGRQATQIAI